MPAKKKRSKEIIVIGKSIKIEDKPDTKPKCYGNKEEYCRPELCGEWYESCKSK